MKTRTLIFSLASILLLALTTCKKDPQPIMERFDLSREDLTIGTTSASIVGTYAYSGAIDEIRVCVSEDGVHPAEFVADINGKNFAVEMTGLRPATSYQYYYSVDYGFSKPFITETKSFTTLSESPTVRTIDVISIDSTTVRVNCETVSDGGVEITERGVCWNTYGNPNLDDESLTYTSAGLGQYSCRISGLALSTKYYVRAYAKNASGIGFGEVLEFETLAEAQLPEVSTVEVNNVTSTTATCMGNVASDGGLELTERGVCWSLSANPTTSGSHAAATDASLGVFEVAMTGLIPNKTYHARAYATNAKGTAYGDDLTFTTTEGLPVVTTSGITEITATSAKGGGEVTDQGASNVTERGICWGTSHNPTTSGTHANSGTGAGSYTVSMANLTPNATYYVRAYATNAQGTAYGAEVSFTALEGLPVVLTLDMTDITSTTAKGHGKVTDQGGSAVTERGICWSTSPSPTTSGSHAQSGTGTGEYTVSISTLTPGTKYYVRAYATNDQGTTYGEQKDFTTAATLPTVVTGDINGTTVHGNVTSDGGATVAERGICWSTSHNPTTAGNHGSSGTGTGTFSVELTDLTPGTTYYVRAYATNSAGTAYGSEKTLTTEATLPTVATGEVSNITQTTAQGSGNVTDDGGAMVTERGVCWSTSHNPTISGNHASNGSGTGGFTVNMTGLTANTHYYVRAYAKNSAGVSYGNEQSFTTSQNVSAPTVTTSQVTNVTQTTATGGGNVTGDGGATVTERGICWSTSHNPTTSGSHANSGTGTGTFTVNMTGLTPNTTYYVRAYAINSAGTSYGSEVSFITLQAITVPTVTTSQVTNIQQTTATGGGNVTNSGGATVTEYGLCWGTSHNPTTSGSHANSGIGMGAFTVNMTGLTANTTYYVRAYATNSAGTAYGVEVNFTTLVGGETYEYVDLGLPSGTLWATCNVGANTPKEYGYYFAWGETTPKTTYNWSTYMYCMGSENTLTKYCNNPNYGYNGYIDNLTTLLPEDDAATANWGDGWCMPTYDQWLELNQNTTLYWTTQDGVNGMLFTASNGNSLFLPAAGLRWDNELRYAGNDGYFWSSSLRSIDQNNAMGFHIDSGGCGMHAYSRSYGQPVRAVRSTSVNYTISVSANPSSGGTVSGGGTFQQGQSCTVTAAANTGYTFTNWTENGIQVSTNANYSFTVTSNRSLVANFTMQVTLPTVTTSQVTNITQTSATGGGNVTNSGGANVTERGICWSTSHNPTTSGSHANSGTGTGSFTVNMTGLTANTTYYVRAYAINSAGTSYGSEVSFTTQQALTVPTVTTSQVTNIQQNSATGGGNVTNSGGANVTERGICWSTSHNPTTSGSHANSGTGTGTYTVNMSGLSPGTTYYVRAYAINSQGTAYGSEVTFTTTAGLPTVTTSQVTNITQTSATGGGNVTATGGANVTERGICWGTSHNPTTSNSHANSGTGTGTYMVNMTSLTANTTYYVRAYAINSAGTAYGSEVSFITQSGGSGNVPTGAINGLFTINASGDQVYFSQGNLQYIGSASTPYWKFAEKQWDCLGDNGQGSTNQNVDRDLFGWGTSGYNHGAVCYQPWSTSRTNSDYYAYGQYNYNLYDQTGQADWGYNAISNGGNQLSQWRVLTVDEWYFVFDIRSTLSSIRYARATVNNVNGVILLPDNWNSSYYYLSNTNQPDASFGSNVISSSAWINSLESHGAVFLPAAGYRNGNGVVGISYDNGNYWSATYSNSNNAFLVHFFDDYLYTSRALSRFIGRSVRLVQDYNR